MCFLLVAFATGLDGAPGAQRRFEKGAMRNLGLWLRDRGKSTKLHKPVQIDWNFLQRVVFDFRVWSWGVAFATS